MGENIPKGKDDKTDSTLFGLKSPVYCILAVAVAAIAMLVAGDESGNGAVVDLGKLQMFFFTFILISGYGAAIHELFAGNSVITALPAVGPGMNVLLGISHTGYLANKTVSHSKRSKPSP